MMDSSESFQSSGGSLIIESSDIISSSVDCGSYSYDGGVFDTSSYINVTTGGNSSGGFCYDYVQFTRYQDSLVIYDPLLIPLCLWALYIGISRFNLMKKASNTYFYALTFLTYGVMMTNAMIADSLVRSAPYTTIFMTIDVSLTSYVACLLLWCGLSDNQLVDPKKIGTRICVILNLILIFLGWIYGIQYSSDPRKWSIFLYMGVVGIGCGTYVFLQFYYLIKNKKLGAIRYLIETGLIGGAGFSIMCFFESKWCSYFGPHLSASYIWFLASDLAMLRLHTYIINSRNNNNQQQFRPQQLNNNNNINYCIINQQPQQIQQPQYYPQQHQYVLIPITYEQP